MGGEVERAYVREARRTVQMREMLEVWSSYLLGAVTLEELEAKYFGSGHKM